MSVITDIFIISPYEHKRPAADTGLDLYVSKTIAHICLGDLRGFDELYDRFMACFSEETPFSIYYDFYDVNLDKAVWDDISKDAYGNRLRLAPNLDNLLACAKEMQAIDHEYRSNAFVGLIESCKDEPNIQFVLYQH